MRTLRIGLLLGFRQIQRANIWTTALIIFVMALTFLNLIVVSGILIGLPVGAEQAVKEKSLGDILISERESEKTILQTEEFKKVLAITPGIAAYTVHYTSGAKIEANYRTRRDLRIDANVITGRIVGIDPIAEDSVTHLTKDIVEGAFLNPNEEGYLVLGSLTLDRYTQGFSDITDSLINVHVNDTVRVTIGQNTKEFKVKGIISAKASEISRSIFMPERELRRLANNNDREANEIIVRLVPHADPDKVKGILVQLGLDKYAKIRTFNESLPKFITDIKDTFNILGVLIGAVGIVVASITIFIIIFINAISRQRQIGILKGIGIQRRVIEVAYVLQAAFYAITGAAIGAVITFVFLVPYFDNNPINFPFSDGILVADALSTLYRFIILFVITLFAGFLPAWIIVKQNTLNSILGRK